MGNVFMLILAASAAFPAILEMEIKRKGYRPYDACSKTCKDVEWEEFR